MSLISATSIPNRHPVAAVGQRNCILPPSIMKTHQQAVGFLSGGTCSLNCSSRIHLQDGYVPVRILNQNQRTQNNPDGFVPFVSPNDADQVPNTVFWNIRKISAFYQQVFGCPLQSSLPDGMFVAIVHDSDAPVNAFWDSQRQEMHFGDGDAVFHNLSLHLDVAAHELTHGFIDGVLTYRGETGAINEHICDVMGLLARFFDEQNRRPLDEDWVIAKGLVGGHSPLRSFVDPGHAYNTCFIYEGHMPCKDQQVQSYPTRLNDPSEDNGGVHSNSGILNRAFYLFWKNSHTKAYTLGEAPWETTGQVWFNTIKKIRAGSPCQSMLDFANLTLGSVASLTPPSFGKHTDPNLSPVYHHLDNAWRAVGFDKGLRPVFK